MAEFSFLAIAIGGGLGSVARFVISREMGNWLGSYLPYGTLTVNVAGSLALGWFATIFLDRPEINSATRLRAVNKGALPSSQRCEYMMPLGWV